jgi:hypothetical protein
VRAKYAFRATFVAAAVQQFEGAYAIGLDGGTLADRHGSKIATASSRRHKSGGFALFYRCGSSFRGRSEPRPCIEYRVAAFSLAPLGPHITSRLFKVSTESQTTVSSGEGRGWRREPRLQSGGTVGSGLGANEGSGAGDRGVIHHRPNFKLWRSVCSYNHAVLHARERDCARAKERSVITTARPRGRT